MNRIPELISEYFGRWGISLPQDAIESQLSGKIQSHGWTIKYLFGVDEQGEFLDFYATHRMTNDRHERIYASGETEDLPALLDFIVCPPDATEPQWREIEREQQEYNNRVMEELKQKGFF